MERGRIKTKLIKSGARSCKNHSRFTLTQMDQGHLPPSSALVPTASHLDWQLQRHKTPNSKDLSLTTQYSRLTCSTLTPNQHLITIPNHVSLQVAPQSPVEQTVKSQQSLKSFRHRRTKIKELTLRKAWKMYQSPLSKKKMNQFLWLKTIKLTKLTKLRDLKNSTSHKKFWRKLMAKIMRPIDNSMSLQKHLFAILIRALRWLLKFSKWTAVRLLLLQLKAAKAAIQVT